MRLIDADATLELLRSLGSRDYRREKGTIMDAMKMMAYPEYTPTVDAVPVVRCKDCKHWKHADGIGCTDFVKICSLAYYMIGENGYCLYGERRTE